MYADPGPAGRPGSEWPAEVQIGLVMDDSAVVDDLGRARPEDEDHKNDENDENDSGQEGREGVKDVHAPPMYPGRAFRVRPDMLSGTELARAVGEIAGGVAHHVPS